MSDTFPKWTNRLPLMIVVGAVLIGTGVTAGVWYYFTPKYTRVGYQPKQPVAFSHAIHADQLGIDCRYCHDDVEESWYSNVPTSSTCMNCHNQVRGEDPQLALVRQSAETGEPIPWVQVHKTPDYVFFNHSVHVNRGISCVECHGQIHKMDEVRHAQSLSMDFCLQCHRNPEQYLRPLDEVTNLDFQWDEDPERAAQIQQEMGSELAHEWKVNATQNCSACHR
jgi:hypothetical protein